MGSCFSIEEEDDPRFVSVNPLYNIRRPAAEPAPTVSRSRSNDDGYHNQYNAVPSSSSRSVPVQNLVPTPNVRPAVVVEPKQEFKPTPGALYGEYNCGCGNFWVSRLSWRDKSQTCRRCRADVLPRNQRELRPSDYEGGHNVEGLDHPQHLCEMCKETGFCAKKVTDVGS